MGLTNFKGTRPTKSEVVVAKNYLSEKEIAVLNRLVSAYFDIAEIQAIEERPMYMKDWMKELDDFISINHRTLLNDASKVSQIEAEAKALKEYEKYKEKGFDFRRYLMEMTYIKPEEYFFEHKVGKNGVGPSAEEYLTKINPQHVLSKNNVDELFNKKDELLWK